MLETREVLRLENEGPVTWGLSGVPLWRADEPQVVVRVGGLPPAMFEVHSLGPAGEPKRESVPLESLASIASLGPGFAAQPADWLVLAAPESDPASGFWVTFRRYSSDGAFLSGSASDWDVFCGRRTYLVPRGGGFAASDTCFGERYADVASGWSRVWPLTSSAEPAGPALDPFERFEFPEWDMTFDSRWYLGLSPMARFGASSALLVARGRGLAGGGDNDVLEAARVEVDGSMTRAEARLGAAWGPVAAAPAGADVLLLGYRERKVDPGRPALEVLRVDSALELTEPVRIADEITVDWMPDMATDGSSVYIAWQSRDATGSSVTLVTLDPTTLQVERRYCLEDATAPRLSASSLGAILTVVRGPFDDGTTSLEVAIVAP